MLRTATLALFLLSVPVAGQDPAVDVALGLERAFASVLEKVRPSIVTVTAYVEIPKGEAPAERANPRGLWTVADAKNRYPGFKRLASVTGFMFDEDGTILTAWHALLGPDRAPVRVIDVETHDGRHTLCRVLGGEPTINIAVLAFDVFPEGNPPVFGVAQLGDSDAVKPGQWALGVGDPFGALRTCAVGIVAAQPLRQCYQGDLTATYLQLSFTAHPESYGGPVVNLRGEVVGVLMPRQPQPLAVPSSGARGVEFAMPIKVVANIATSLKTVSGQVEKKAHQSPWLGISVLELAVARAAARSQGAEALRKVQAPLTGVHIDDVYDPGPASKIGVVAGDYLLSIDGQRLFSVLDFQKWLYLKGVGREVELELYRNGETRKTRAVIQPRPASVKAR